MSLVAFGQSLDEFLRAASEEVVLVAPFIKKATLERLLGGIADGVSVVCVTRWRLAEVAAGVSDLGVWELLEDPSRGRLYLNNNLHAKYYRADKGCLIGSANLTATALGWSPNPNVEILVPPADCQSLRFTFERNLLASSVEVDNALFESAVAAVEAMPPLVFQDTVAWNAGGAGNEQVVDVQISGDKTWLPRLRYPEYLYLAYCNELDALTTVARDVATEEVKNFRVLPGLPRKAFEAEIGIQMLSQPIVHGVDNFLKEPRRFGAVRDYLARTYGEDYEAFDASSAWQTLMRWLLYFAPNRFALAIPSHSEIMYRRNIYGRPYD